MHSRLGGLDWGRRAGTVWGAGWEASVDRTQDSLGPAETERGVTSTQTPRLVSSVLAPSGPASSAVPCRILPD